MKKNIYGKIILPVIIFSLMFMPGCVCGGEGDGYSGGGIPSVSVGTQSEIITATIADTVTFPVTTENIDDDIYSVTVNNLPVFLAKNNVTITITITDGSGELTLACDENTEAGTTDTLTLTIDGVTSPPFTLTIADTGDGSPDNPFIIGSRTTLQKVGTGTDGWSLSAYYKQVGDIDLSSVNSWTRIGSSGALFTGSYDGDGYTISNLKITGSIYTQGLFGEISGTVKNVKLTDVDICITNNNAGAVAGWNRGTVENCSVAGRVKGTTWVGGVVGNNDSGGTVQNCYADCDVEGSSVIIGGVVGRNNSGGTVKNCYATGSVKGSNQTGGVVGHNNGGIVQNCYAAGDVSGNSSASGGVVGWNQGTVENCVALNNNVKANFTNTSNIGRVIGQASGTRLNNYGRKGMPLTYKNDRDPYIPAESDADHRNGADADPTQYNSLDFWRDIVGFGFVDDIATNPWKWVGSGDEHSDDAHPELYWQ